MATGPTQQLITGQRTLPYLFKCYRSNMPFSPCPVLPDKAGVYVFADLSRTKSNNVDDTDVKVLYVGRTKSYRKRINESHEEWHNAKKLNATHVCLYDEIFEENRINIERDIYITHNPPLNDKRP